MRMNIKHGSKWGNKSKQVSLTPAAQDEDEVNFALRKWWLHHSSSSQAFSDFERHNKLRSHACYICDKVTTYL